MSPPENAEATMEVRIWRGDSDGGEFKGYRVPVMESQTVLDVVTWIQRHEVPDLAYRFACRVGMCGSCAMEVNGEPRWTCRTHVNRVTNRGTLQIAPLRNLPVIRDLACDMSAFFDKWVQAGGKFEGSTSRNDPVAPVSPQSVERMAADAGVECINCAICYSACDVVRDHPGYLGPAALNRAWTLLNDIRDQDGKERLRKVSGKNGCHNCHSQQGCQHYCPKELNPTASIAGLKKRTMFAALKGDI